MYAYKFSDTTPSSKAANMTMVKSQTWK